MRNHKTAISLTLIGLFAANIAFALPEFQNLEDAKSVIHNVETKERRVSGHKMHIQTLVYGDGEELIREYAANCSINGKDEILRFRIHQKGE
jgi:hypothetical protein